MAKGYRQLTCEQRCQIYALHARGDSGRKIACHLRVSHTTVNRELERNKGQRGYRYKQAEEKCQQRRHCKTGRNVKMTPALIATIEEKLTQCQWSPEQISGWLKRERDIRISHECIYQHIWQDKRHGGYLYTHLRRRAKKYQKRVNGKTSRGRIVGRVDITQRPAVVGLKNRIGDWEADTLVGLGHKSAIVSLVERKSRYTKLVKVLRNTAQAVDAAITTALTPLKELVHTITFDNGKEFSSHLQVADKLQAQTFFATPYHSWERGLNENTNGLVRQYFPKKTDFATLTDADVARVEDLLNNRPRKCLGYNTPARAIQQVA